MRRNLKKVLALGLSAVMASAMLAGCGTGGNTTTAAAEAAKTEANGDAAAEKKEEDTAAKAEAPASETDYPTKYITAVCPFGPTSGTDGMSRTLCTIAEQYLGQTITVTNKTGASGSVGSLYVAQQPADGYTLLTGSESTSMFHAMGTADLGYDDFIPILLYMRECGIMITYADSPYQSLQELIDAAKAAPGKISVGTTGVGGLPDIWWTILEAEFDVQFNRVAFDASGDANTALMGKHIEAFVAGTQTSYPLMQDGSVRALAVMDSENIEGYEEVPKLSELFPQLEKYMPYGPFFVVSVKAGTDQAIVDKLTDAFKKAYETPEFQEYIKTCKDIPLGLTGEEANTFMKRQQAVVSWMLYDIGATETAPSEYGVERVEE